MGGLEYSSVRGKPEIFVNGTVHNVTDSDVVKNDNDSDGVARLKTLSSGKASEPVRASLHWDEIDSRLERLVDSSNFPVIYGSLFAMPAEQCAAIFDNDDATVKDLLDKLCESTCADAKPGRTDPRRVYKNVTLLLPSDNTEGPCRKKFANIRRNDFRTMMLVWRLYEVKTADMEEWVDIFSFELDDNIEIQVDSTWSGWPQSTKPVQTLQQAEGSASNSYTSLQVQPAEASLPAVAHEPNGVQMAVPCTTQLWSVWYPRLERLVPDPNKRLIIYALLYGCTPPAECAAIFDNDDATLYDLLDKLYESAGDLDEDSDDDGLCDAPMRVSLDWDNIDSRLERLVDTSKLPVVYGSLFAMPAEQCAAIFDNDDATVKDLLDKLYESADAAWITRGQYEIRNAYVNITLLLPSNGSSAPCRKEFSSMNFVEFENTVLHAGYCDAKTPDMDTWLDIFSFELHDNMEIQVDSTWSGWTKPTKPAHTREQVQQCDRGVRIPVAPRDVTASVYNVVHGGRMQHAAMTNTVVAAKRRFAKEIGIRRPLCKPSNNHNFKRCMW